MFRETDAKTEIRKYDDIKQSKIANTHVTIFTFSYEVFTLKFDIHRCLISTDESP